MNIAVFVKHVPDVNEADLAVASDGRSVKAAGLPFQMNEWDRFALEEGVRLKEAGGGTLTAFLLGPEEHEESLRRCLAVGADRAVRVWDQSFADAGPLTVAGALAGALGNERFDLYFFGAQAADDGYGMVGPAFAEILGLPSASLVNGLTLQPPTLKVTRELEGGWSEVLEMDLPAVLCLQTGINEPRYVSILGIKKARTKPIDLLDANGVGLNPDAVAELQARLVVEGFEPPPEGKLAELWSGSNEEIAAKFVAAVGGAK